MRILLAGDSWGIGVFSGQGDNYGPTNQGIHTILSDLGHDVTNISKAGGSNWLMIDRLSHQWNNTDRCLFGVDPRDCVEFDLQDIDQVIFLQTDVMRERHYYGKQSSEDVDTRYKILEQAFVDSLLNFNNIQEFINDYFSKLYSRLNQFGVSIICVGGWSQLHPSIVDYTNLIPAVPSATKLLIPELKHDCYLSDPEWYIQLDKDSRITSKFGTELKQMACENADKLDLIYKNWHEVHPDIDGYRLIVNELLPYLAKKV